MTFWKGWKGDLQRLGVKKVTLNQPGIFFPFLKGIFKVGTISFY